MDDALATTHLYTEIHEQPGVIARLLDAQRGPVEALARAIRDRGITHVVIAARGTSDNAARYAQYVLGVRNNLLVGLAAPSIFTIYGRAPRLSGALVLGVSQSGRSPDIVTVLAEARRQGALTAVFTNDVASDLAEHGDHIVDLHAGEERAVAATKTYTAELAAIALLSATLSGEGGAMEALTQVPAAVADVLQTAPAVAALAPRYCFIERAVVIGRGFNYATAFELALKLKELTYTVVEPYSSADFLHGPLAMVERGFPVVVLAPSGALLGEMQSLVRTLEARQAELLCITDRPDAFGSTRRRLDVPRSLPEWLSPLTMIVPGQLLAMSLAGVRGYDIDSPRAIRKVTETR